jgi:deoxyribodipyrimidine photo-lyase
MTPEQRNAHPTMPFPPTRAEALSRLKTFVPNAGRAYAQKRNYDLPEAGHPHVSRLSPYIRHRLVTETEVAQAILARHSLTAAEKFIQEVFWRTYWKGWLEQRPQVWASYRDDLAQAIAQAGRDRDLSQAWARAEAGETGIAAFDAWARELVETGYLHNHARMWAASIWIFTLRLPWQLGADFFLRHLLDGDPASNTLGWRWVAGLQTQGKHYLAQAANIAKYTENRHHPDGQLETAAGPLHGPPPPPPVDLKAAEAPRPGARTVVLLHEDDLSPGYLFALADLDIVGLTGLLATDGRSPGRVSPKVADFAQGAMTDCLHRWRDRADAMMGPQTDPEAIADWAHRRGAEQVVAPYAPVGPAASALRRVEKALTATAIPLHRPRRPFDSAAWPHATKGFFRFKKAIPDLVDKFVV